MESNQQHDQPERESAPTETKAILTDPIEPNEHQHGAKDQEHKPDNTSGSDNRWRRPDIFSLAFDGIVAVAAAVGLCFIYAQTREIRRANDIAAQAIEEAKEANQITRQSAAAASRAWVGLESANAVDIEPGKAPGVVLEFLNSGHSPAMNGRVNVRFAIRPFEAEPIDDPVDLTTDEKMAGSVPVLFPEQRSVSEVHVESVITANGHAQINSALTILVVRGWIQYDDGFGRHVTHFCGSANLKERPNGAMAPCRTGNDAN
jgi:hypothetical protein